MLVEMIDKQKKWHVMSFALTPKQIEDLDNGAEISCHYRKINFKLKKTGEGNVTRTDITT